MPLANSLFLCVLLYIQIASTVANPAHHFLLPKTIASMSIKLFTPPQQLQQQTQQTNVNSTTATPFQRQQEQCSCLQCSCGEFSCPKSLQANSFTVLASREACLMVNAPAIGLINIQSTFLGYGFQYYLVDETNKNKAMRGQSFEYSAYKSNNVASTCVKDNLPPIRFPSTIPGKAYLIARSTNVLLNTDVTFNIDMKCAVAPAKIVEFSTRSSNGDKYYVGAVMDWNFKFLNEFYIIDSWQKGKLSADGFTTSFSNGEATLRYTPSRAGSLSLSVLYTPDASLYGKPIYIQTHTIQVLEPDIMTSIWNWIMRDTKHLIGSIVVLCFIVAGVLLLCIIATFLICRRRRMNANVGLTPLKYEKVTE